MNSSIIYVYLGIVMIIVSATTFYVRTIKSKLDTKVDAMFQLVQSLVNEVNQLKMGQSGGSKPKEVIELDINSSNNGCCNVKSHNDYSDESEEGDESDDSDDSDESDDSDDNDDSEDSDNAKDSFITSKIISNDSPHEVNMQNAVEPVQVEPVQVEPVQVEPVQVEPVVVELEPSDLDLEVKQVKLETNEQNYDSFTVKELKELVNAKGGKVTGKKKSELIEYLLS